ncbi:hypothetical protein [Prevotella sp. OH937_COT-195]|uniref:hypothetical protein n=1 Tax=Prevotella sp. OH937_COT-195 TaxID=2491051 RepID=UPI00131575DE|nr:hypothetical protein [Prevotella sp. OH937_COT-195]
MPVYYPSSPEFADILNPNRSLDRICLDLILPLRFPTALARLLTSAQQSNKIG